MVHRIKGSLQITPATIAPVSPEKGEIYYDDSDGLKAYDGNEWKVWEFQKKVLGGLIQIIMIIL